MLKQRIVYLIMLFAAWHITYCSPLTIEELESQLKLLNTPQEETIAWESVAQDCLLVAQDFLNSKYNYQSAITWFLHAITLCENKLSAQDTKASIAQAYIGLSMSFHHLGDHRQRDLYMKKAQNLLAIPENLNNYRAEKFDKIASSYFIVNGYRCYVNYENCEKNHEPLTQQEHYLNQAKDSFLKALEIAHAYTAQELDTSHAQHGLGTIFEFLSKSEQKKGNPELAQRYLYESAAHFECALDMRKKLLGENHPHVARSCHKLARNYALLSTVLKHENCPEQKLYTQANSYYQQAQAIYEQNNIYSDPLR